MNFTVEWFLKDAKYMLAKWEKDVEKVENGTYPYDGSMPKTCVDALCYSKVQTYKNVIAYLETLPKDLAIQTSRGCTKEGSEYYRLVNK